MNEASTSLATALATLTDLALTRIDALRRNPRLDADERVLAILQVLDDAARERARAAGYNVEAVERGLYRLARPGFDFAHSLPMTSAEILSDLDFAEEAGGA